MFNKAKTFVQYAIATIVVVQTAKGLASMGRETVHIVENRYFNKK